LSHARRVAASLAIALLALSSAGCSGEPAPSCGAFTLDRGETIPQEAVERMSEGGEDRALRITVPSAEGDPIVTTYAPAVQGGIVMNVDYGGGTSIFECSDAASVVDLGDCEELHEGH
jgi:hypothetical protein